MSALASHKHHLKFLIWPLALCAFASPSLAQQPTTNASGAGEMPPGLEDMNDAAMSRQEVREEMQKIREEHEDLEIRHDQLRIQCLNAKGQERAVCHQKWEDLEQQKEALHVRIRALHERLEALREQHPPQHHAMNNGPVTGAAVPVPSANTMSLGGTANAPPASLPPTQ